MIANLVYVCSSIIFHHSLLNCTRILMKKLTWITLAFSFAPMKEVNTQEGENT